MGAPKYSAIKRRVDADQRAKEARLNPREVKDYAEINTKESVCHACGFKARYKFIRCPECNAVQEEKKDG
jgi:lipopolysaccharide biosynthesis regulator YciM